MHKSTSSRRSSVVVWDACPTTPMNSRAKRSFTMPIRYLRRAISSGGSTSYLCAMDSGTWCRKIAATKSINSSRVVHAICASYFSISWRATPNKAPSSSCLRRKPGAVKMHGATCFRGFASWRHQTSSSYSSGQMSIGQTNRSRRSAWRRPMPRHRMPSIVVIIRLCTRRSIRPNVLKRMKRNRCLSKP